MSPGETDSGRGKILFLLGFMGSGKTWLSHRLADKLGMSRFDLDEEIEREQGMSIAEFFERHGEAAFRKTERETLERLCETIRASDEPVAENPQGIVAVVSTGGGTPCFGDNMEWMNANGTTLWLDTPKVALLERLREGRCHRPLIKGLDDKELEAYIESTLEMRRRYYAKANLHWRGGGDLLDFDKIWEHA